MTALLVPLAIACGPRAEPRSARCPAEATEIRETDQPVRILLRGPTGSLIERTTPVQRITDPADWEAFQAAWNLQEGEVEPPDFDTEQVLVLVLAGPCTLWEEELQVGELDDGTLYAELVVGTSGTAAGCDTCDLEMSQAVILALPRDAETNGCVRQLEACRR